MTVTENPNVQRPTVGSVETRAAPAATTPTVDGRRLCGVVPINVASRDLGGWTEVIDPGALDGTRLDDLVATVDHAGIPLGRYPSTLDVDRRPDGLHWSLTLPESRSDVREAVERRDLRACSWRMVVGRDRWDGDVRHVEQVAELRDVSVVTSPAYAGAAAEYRDAAGAAENVTAGHVSTETTTAGETRQEDENIMQTEDRTEGATGGLQVADRVTAAETRTLGEAFRAEGFPGETATVDFGEFRAATFAGAMDTLAPGAQRVGVGLGADTRYVWPAFPQVAVDGGDTAVQVLRQTTRALPVAGDVIRAIDAVTTKPEVDSELAIITEPLRQVAAIQSNIPNVFLEQPAFNSTIEGDLRLALNEALDKLVLDMVAASGIQAPGTDPLLVSIRKAITVIQASGYSPDTLVLRPADAEALDTLRATETAGEQYYVFAPASLAPRSIFGLNVRISKTAAAPVVTDSTALGRLYVSPITLARFEVDAGATNRSNVRLEGHAAFGVERQAAAVRIAAA